MKRKTLIILIGILISILIPMGIFLFNNYFAKDKTEEARVALKNADKLYITYKYKEALPIYEKQYDYTTIPQKINMSDAYYKIGDSVRASYILEELFKQGNVSIDYYTMFYLKAGGREVLLHKEDKALEYYKKAVEYSEKSSYKEQIQKEYSNFIYSNPYPEELKTAIAYFENIIETTEQKHNYETYYKLGNLYYNDNQANRALLNWNKALSYNKKHIESMEKIAMLYLTLEYYEEAFNMYKSILKLDTNNWQAFIGVGDYYFEKKEYREARRNYQEALSHKNENDYVRLQLGKVYMALNENTKAYDYLAQIVTRDKSENMVKEAKLLLKEIGEHGFVNPN